MESERLMPKQRAEFNGTVGGLRVRLTYKELQRANKRYKKHKKAVEKAGRERLRKAMKRK